MSTVRPPAVAGTFYPADPAELAGTVDSLLADVPAPTHYSNAIIAPHAGYIYSGPTAAIAHKTLDPKTRRVLLLGPTHRVGINGMALTGADYQRTPLGDIPTDKELTAALELLPEVITAPIVHAQEHSLEVQLPFLQRHLEPGFSVVPVAVGQATPQDVAAVIEAALDLPNTAVVVSSDLSHYLPYDVARKMDFETLHQIARRESALDPDQACGAFPVSGLMRYARDHGLSAALLDVRNSGDTAGDKSAVVGYPAIAWYSDDETVVGSDLLEADGSADDSADRQRPSPDLAQREEQQLGEALTHLAYDAIADQLGRPRLTQAAAKSPSATLLSTLESPGATFVTLNLNGALRGCIGSLVAHRSLAEDVAANALAAAFEDPRFPPLSAEEFSQIDLEVSVLTPALPLWTIDEDAPPEAQVAACLRPGVDGVVLQFGSRRATYLPQVWAQIPDPMDFLANLKAKAGLPPRFWDPQLRVETYQVREYHLDRSADQ